jgi:hypothetical protein
LPPFRGGPGDYKQRALKRQVPRDFGGPRRKPAGTPSRRPGPGPAKSAGPAVERRAAGAIRGSAPKFSGGRCSQAIRRRVGR